MSLVLARTLRSAARTSVLSSQTLRDGTAFKGGSPASEDESEPEAVALAVRTRRQAEQRAAPRGGRTCVVAASRTHARNGQQRRGARGTCLAMDGSTGATPCGWRACGAALGVPTWWRGGGSPRATSLPPSPLPVLSASLRRRNRRMVKLYYTPTSCGAASFIVASLCGLTIQCEEVDLGTHKTASGADFYAINPKGARPLKMRAQCGVRGRAKRATGRSRRSTTGTSPHAAPAHRCAAGNVPALVLDDGTLLNEGAAVLQCLADMARRRAASRPWLQLTRQRARRSRRQRPCRSRRARRATRCKTRSTGRPRSCKFPPRLRTHHQPRIC